MINLAGSDDDEAEKGRKNYTNIPEYVRVRNIIIKTGPGQDDYARIPLPFGLIVPYLFGHELALLMTGQIGVGEFAGNVVGGAVNAYNPLGGMGFGALVPTLLDPAYDIAVNTNPLSGAPIRPKETQYNEGIPKAEQYFSTTPEYAISIAQFIRNATSTATGGSMVLDLYPDEVKYFFNKVTGGVGQFGGEIQKWGENLYNGIETKASETPVVKSFVPVQDRESNRYYDARKEILGDANNLRDKVKKYENNPTDKLLDEIIDLSEKTGGVQRGDEIKWSKNGPYKMVQDADEEISDLRKEIVSIRSDKDLSPLQKQKKILDMEQSIKDVMVSTRSAIATKDYSGPLSQYINRE
jgi:hypothetical protein